MALNEYTFYGKCSFEPQLQTSAKGVKYLRFSVTSYEVYTDKSGAKQKRYPYLNMMAYGQNAQYISDHCHKGTFVAGTAKVETTSKQNANGKKDYQTTVTVTTIHPAFGTGEQEQKSEALGGVNFDEVDISDIDPDQLPF